ncbi:MAG TPA: hypothetical protein PLV61_17605, partial [Parvularculaceae bacterium]|nr:hypothetical protein [Parvularculaceae bacterium]
DRLYSNGGLIAARYTDVVCAFARDDCIGRFGLFESGQREPRGYRAREFTIDVAAHGGYDGNG